MRAKMKLYQRVVRPENLLDAELVYETDKKNYFLLKHDGVLIPLLKLALGK